MKKKFYAVWKAGGTHIDQIYTTWSQVQTLGLTGGKTVQKGFSDRRQAEVWLQTYRSQDAKNASSSSSPSLSSNSTPPNSSSTKRKATAPPPSSPSSSQRQRQSIDKLSVSTSINSNASSNISNSSSGNVLQDTLNASWKRVKADPDYQGQFNASSDDSNHDSDSDDGQMTQEDDANSSTGKISKSNVPEWEDNHSDISATDKAPSKPRPTIVTCDPHQRAAVEAVLDGKNVYLTGVAGTGKSHCIDVIKTELENKGTKFTVLAPTGAAAVNVGGCTIHSFTKIGLPKATEDFDKMWAERDRLRQYKIWIIDEISMVSGELFDNVARLMRKINNNPQAFGGIQIIASGDFCQLPPVFDEEISGTAIQRIVDKEGSMSYDRLFLNRGYAFAATEWSRCEFETIRLETVHRQRDVEMVQVLQNVRRGVLNRQVQEFVRECRRRPASWSNNDSSSSSSSSSSSNNSSSSSRSSNSSSSSSPFVSASTVIDLDSIVATQLFSKNIDADRVNEEQLERLKGTTRTFVGNDRVEAAAGVELNNSERRHLQSKFDDSSTFRAPKELELKIGGQVMLLMNQTDQPLLVNGSRGEIVEFKHSTLVASELKAQLKDLENKTKGKTTSSESEESDKKQINKIKKELDDLSKNENQSTDFPVVRFQNGLLRTFIKQEFEYKLYGVGKAVRSQVPLMLAWAISIHKSQGMSIDKLKVSVEDAFAEGQAYVALSRATSKQGLEIKSWKDSCVKVNLAALKFDRTGQVDEDWTEEAERNWPEQMKAAIERDAVTPPKCNCAGDYDARRGRVRKPGRNHGRYFFSCHIKYGLPGRCDLFEWMDNDNDKTEE